MGHRESICTNIGCKSQVRPFRNITVLKNQLKVSRSLLKMENNRSTLKAFAPNNSQVFLFSYNLTRENQLSSFDITF